MRRPLHIDLSPPRIVGEAVQIGSSPQPQPSPRSILFAAASPVTPATPALAAAADHRAASGLAPAAVSPQLPPSPLTADDGRYTKSLLLAHVTGSGVAARRGGGLTAGGRAGGSSGASTDATAAPVHSHFEPLSHGQAPSARRIRELPVALRPVFEDLMHARAEAAASSASTTAAASSAHAVANPALPLKRAAVLKLAESGAVTLAADPDESRLEPAPRIVREIPTADDLRAQAKEAALARRREVAAAAKAKADAAEEAKRVWAANKAAKRTKGKTASSPTSTNGRSRTSHSLQVPGRSTIATESAEVQALRAELDRQQRLNAANEAALATQLAHANRSEAVRNAEDEAARLAALPKPPPPAPLPVVPFSAQGDLEMYTSLNMDRRMAIRLAPEFVRAVQQFWLALETHESQPKSAAMVAPRTAFIKMLMLIFTFLHAEEDAQAEGDEGEAAASTPPADPLASDAVHSADRLSALFTALVPDVSSAASSRSRTISFPEFHDALFQLADTWTLSAELHEYLAFLEAVLRGITRQKTEAEMAADVRSVEQRMHGGGGGAGGSKPQSPHAASPRKAAALQGIFKLALEGSPLDSSSRTASKSVSAAPSRPDSPLPPIVYSSDDSDNESKAAQKKRAAAQAATAAATANDPTLVARMAQRASLLAPATPSRRPSLPSSETSGTEEKTMDKPATASRLTATSLPAEPALAVSMPFSTVSRVALATRDQESRDAAKLARLAAKMARLQARDSTSSTFGSSSTTNSGRSSQGGVASSSAEDDIAAKRVKSVQEGEDDESDEDADDGHKRASQWGLSAGRAKASERDQSADGDLDEANRAWLAAEAAKRQEQLRRASASTSPVRSGAASRRTSITRQADRSPSSRRGPRSPSALAYGDLVPFDPLLISTHIGVGADGELTGSMSPIRALVARPAASRPRTSEGLTTPRANPRMMWPASPLPSPSPSTPGAQVLPSPRKSPRAAVGGSRPPSRFEHVDSFKASGDSRSLSARQSALDVMRARMVAEARAQELKRLKDVVIKMGGVQAQVTEAMLREAKPKHARTASSMHAMAALTLQLQAASGLSSARTPKPPPAPLSAPVHVASFSGSNLFAPTQPQPSPRSAGHADAVIFDDDELESPPSPVLGPTLADSDPALTYSARWGQLREEKRAARELALKQASLDDVGLCESVYRNRVYLAANHRSNQNASETNEAEEKQEVPNLAGQLREHAAGNGIIRMLLDTPRSLQARAARFPIYASRPLSVARQRPDSQRVHPAEFDLTRTFHDRIRDANEIARIKRESTTHAPSTPTTAVAYPSGSQTASPGTAPLNDVLHAHRSIAHSPAPQLRDPSPDGEGMSLAASPPKHPWRPRPNSSVAMPARARQLEHVVGRPGTTLGVREEEFRRAPLSPNSPVLFVQAQRHTPEAHAWSLPRPSRPSSSPNGVAHAAGYSITHFPSPPASAAQRWREINEREDDLDDSDQNDPQPWESDQSDRTSPSPVVPPSPRLVCVETNPGPCSRCGGRCSNEAELSAPQCTCDAAASTPQLAASQAATSDAIDSAPLCSVSDATGPVNPAVPLPLSEVRRQVAAHFSSPLAYQKEVLETTHVMRFLRSDAPAQVLSLACGGAVGAESFADHFPHAQSRLHGIDIQGNQTARFYESQGLLQFVQADLFVEPPAQPALHVMSSCETWLAIHACRHLAHRVLQLFKLHAPAQARLLIVPCCLMRRTEITAKVGARRWKEIKAVMQGQEQTPISTAAVIKPALTHGDGVASPGMSNTTAAASSESPLLSSSPIVPVTGMDYRTSTSMFLRNELLASEFAESFVGYVHMAEIPSQYNTGLYFVKKQQ